MMHQPATQPGSSGTINLLDYWKIVRDGRWTILAVFTIVLGLVALWTFTQTPVYKAITTIEVRTETRRILPGQDVSGMGANGFGWAAEERYYNTQIEILKSRDLAERVVRRLGLENDPMFAGIKDPGAILARMVNAVPRPDTGILEVSLTGANPKRIAELVNAVSQEYVQRNIDQAKQNMRTLLDEMNHQVEELSDTTKKAEHDKFEQLNKDNLFVPENQQKMLADQLSKYMETHTSTQIEVGRLRAILESYEEVVVAGGDPSNIKDIAKEDSVSGLLKERAALEKDIEGMRVTYLPNHPKMIETSSKLEAVHAKINDQVDRIIQGYRAQLNVQARQEQDLAERTLAAQDQLYQTGKNATAYDIAKRDADTKARVYEAIQGKLNEMTVTSGLLANNINLLDPATVPTRPIRPRKLMNLFLGAMIGMLAGVGVVLVIDHMDNTVKSIEDVEEGLKLPVLSIIPRYRDTTGHAVKEAFQVLKTNVLFSSDARKRNLLLLTSAGPREGKSSTLINLARTIASAGERVVVVDCDLRRPTVHVHLDVERDHGLTNYLTGDEGDDIDTYLKNSKVPNLYVLTCGPIPPNPPELFSSERFKNLISDLRTRFDWVLIDSPPVISLTDSVILASMADMVAFVVKHNESEREMIRRCLQNIRNVNPHVIGAILNDVDIEKSYSKDYYYTGYYYYSGESDKKGKRKKRDSSSNALGDAGAVT